MHFFDIIGGRDKRDVIKYSSATTSVSLSLSTTASNGIILQMGHDTTDNLILKVPIAIINLMFLFIFFLI